jgi:hypothetical protein
MTEQRKRERERRRSPAGKFTPDEAQSTTELPLAVVELGLGRRVGLAEGGIGRKKLGQRTRRGVVGGRNGPEITADGGGTP